MGIRFPREGPPFLFVGEDVLRWICACCWQFDIFTVVIEAVVEFDDTGFFDPSSLSVLSSSLFDSVFFYEDWEET